MAGALLITLREGLEAALIVSILLAYLSRTGRSQERSAVWVGVALAVLVSLAAGYVVFTAIGSLEGRAEQLFEGIALLAAVGILTYTILWMRKQSHTIASNLRRKVDAASGSTARATLIALSFLVVVREGLETALFLIGAASLADGLAVGIGGAAGLAIAIAIGTLIYRGALRLDIGKFFAVTSALLIVFAAGMLGYGMHELIEAGVVPAIVDPIWNVNHIVNDKAGVGLFLKALFGYNGNPALTEGIAYVGYLLAMGLPLLRERLVTQPQHAASPA